MEPGAGVRSLDCMVEDGHRRRPRVLIAGGGVAALEAALALRDLAGDRVGVELCSPRGEFVYRPFAVGEPYGAAGVIRGDLDSLAGRMGASFRLGGILSVDPRAGLATARGGERTPFDYMLVATGARMLSAVPGSVTFWGAADEGGVGGVVRKLRAGALRDVAFVAGGSSTWASPLYELALLGSAVLARSGIEDGRLTVVTSEDAPLRLFGRPVEERMTRLLEGRRIEVVTGTHAVEFDGKRLKIDPGESIETDAVVSLPRFEGHGIDGLPHDEESFLQVDEHCRVRGVERVYAAGDVTSFPVKHGAIATLEADAAAEAIAAAAGCELEPVPFDPADAGLWAERDGKITGRYLTPFLNEFPGAGGRAAATEASRR
jgi:sulfide:quinone oxidoreductase